MEERDLDTLYDTYADDLLTMDYDELVEKYGESLAKNKFKNSEKLSKKQLELYTFISKYIKNYGYSPTIRDICKIFNKSVGSIHPMLKILERKGYIVSEKGKARTIKILK